MKNLSLRILKSEILKKFSRREIQEHQQNESFVTSKPIVTSSSNNPSASGEHKMKRVCKICNAQGHLAHNCHNKRMSNKQIYTSELIDWLFC